MGQRTLRWGQTNTADTSGNTVAYNWACNVVSPETLTTTLLPVTIVEMDGAWGGYLASLRVNDDNLGYMARVENGTALSKRLSYTLDDLPPNAITVDSVVAGYRINTQTNDPGIDMTQGIRDGGVGSPASGIQSHAVLGWTTFEVPVTGPAGGGVWTPQKVNDCQMYMTPLCRSIPPKTCASPTPT